MYILRDFTNRVHFMVIINISAPPSHANIAILLVISVPERVLEMG